MTINSKSGVSALFMLPLVVSCGSALDPEGMWDLPGKKQMAEHCESWGFDRQACESEWQAAVWLDGNGDAVPDSVRRACNALVEGELPSYARLRECAGRQPSEILPLLAGRVEDEDVIEELLDEGANLLGTDPVKGGSALHWAAAANPDRDVLQLLLERGANVNATDQGYGDTPLHWAAKGNPDPKVIEMLVDAGAKVNHESGNHVTPLLLAVWFNPELDVVEALLDAGANAGIGDEQGRSVLSYAKNMRERKEGRRRLVRMLEQAGQGR